MSKNIQVKLTFSTDTKAAQQQLNQLQQTLSNIAATPITGSGLKTAQADIQAATSKALELKIALQNATNVNTGKLNFNKFNQELKKNKTTLKEYAMQLQKLGPEGVQAFSQLAQSIRTAETPLVSMQGKLAALGQTFMNTVKWSISSSMIQGVTRAFTSTIDYAKELNKDLTQIRIVTGKSVEDISKFAVEANKAAKALSATTSEYAKASLIYFQQGLDGNAVAERTATTLKLAKVVGESAETTSEWMTAIWNNFDDGSRSLENYADVLAKLGAATASSADEIAGGLEKFAAVAETVGLSYEYAASALATITAETRQSEDVVGTALKTIFARVENLKLGETLEDGTTLGQYSEALAKVGVNIKDSNGQLKEMDDILKEMGTTWGVLNRDQQVALAQSVAGIRQYSQFMALMDNWDVMEKNVEMAKEANGALEDQHEIWETGIEGATSRVKEELNEIKNNLLGENDLLPLLNIAEGFLDFIGDLVDSLGGLPGLLSIIASVGLKLWGPQAAAGLTSMVNGVKSLYGVASGKSQAAQADMAKEASGLEADMKANTGSGQRGMVDSGIAKKEADLTALILDNEKNISADKKQQIEFERQLLQIQEKRLQKIADEHDAAQSGADKARRKLETMDVDNDDVDRLETAAKNTAEFNSRATNIETTELNGDADAARQLGQQGEALIAEVKNSGGVEAGSEQDQALTQARNELSGATDQYANGVSRLAEEQADLKKKEEALKTAEDKLAKTTGKSKEEIKAAEKEVTKAKKAFSDQKTQVDGTKKSVEEYGKKVKTAQGNVSKAVKGVNEYGKTLGELKGKYGEAGDALEEFGDNTLEAAHKNIELEEGQKDLGNSFEETGKKVKGAAAEGQGWTTSFVNGMQGVASAAAGVQMMMGAVDSLTTAIADGSAGFSDYLSAITSIGFALPMFVKGIQSVSQALKLEVAWKKLSVLWTKNATKEEQKNAAAVMAAGIKKIGSKIAEAGANYIAMLTNWPVGTITALALAGAIAGIIGGTVSSINTKKTAAQEEETDNKAIETAEGALEVAEGWNEESQAMDDLIDKHNKLNAANDQTIEGQKALKEAQQAIIDQVPQLIEKYKELDKEYENLDLTGDIAVLEGAAANKDVEQIEQLTNDIDTKVTEETSRIAKEGQSGAAGRTLAAIAEQTGDSVDNKAIDWHVGDVGSDVGEKKLSKILGQTFSGEGVNISLDANDPKAFVKQYEKLQQFVTEMEEAGHTSDDTYREVKEGIDAAAESYEKLKTLVEEGKTYEIQDRVNKMKDIDLSQVDSYKEYTEVVEKLTSDKELLNIATEEEIKTWIEGKKVFSEYATLEKKAEAYGAKYGETYANSIKEYVKDKNLNDDDLAAFIKIDFDKFQIEKTWDGLIKYTKHLDKAEAIQKEVKAVSSAEKNLKSNGTAEDYQKLQEGLSWGEDGLVKFSTFLKQSYSEQKAYLEDIKIKKAEAAQKEYKAALDQLKLTQEEYVLQLKQAKLSGDTFLQGQIEAELYQLRQKIEATETSIELAKLEVKQAKEAQQQRIRDFKNNKQALEDEYDAYRRINELSEDLSRAMTKISEAKDAAYGGKHLALLNAEIKGLEVENQLLDKTIKLANKRAATKKQELTSNYGAKFDEFGNISNYNDIQGKYLQDLATLEATKGKDSEEYKNKKEDYDDFVKLAEDYEEDLDKAEEATDKKASNMRAILDKKLEGIQYVIDIKVEVSEGRLKVLERLLSKLDDDAYDGASRIVNYQQQADQYIEQQNTSRRGIEDTLKANNVSDKDIQAYLNGDGAALKKYNLGASTMDQLTTLTDQFTSAQDGLNELDENVKNELMTTFNAWHDKIEDIGTSLQNYQSIMENYKNIVDTIGMKKLGLSEKDIRNMEEATQKTLDAQVANAKAQMDTTKAALEDVQKKKAGAKVGSEEYKYWEEREKELSRQLEEDTANATSLWASAIDNAYTTFEEQTQRAIVNFEDAVAGANFKSLDELQGAIDKQNQASERYLSNYEKAYELSKLNRNIQKEMDSIDDPRKKKALAELQEEIAQKTADGVKMSKNDLRYLQQKYDLKVAEIALEEAQNAKSQVRLQKDSSGNFNYVYTADSNNVANAEQKYEDAMYEMEKSNEEYLNNLQEQIISNRQAMIDELSELNIQDYANAEEYEKAKAEIIKYYTEQEAYYMQEMQKQFGYNKEHYDQDIVFYSNYNQAKAGLYGQDTITYDAYVVDKKDKDKQIVDSFGETVLGMETGFSNIQGYHSAFLTAIGTAGKNGKGGSGLLGDMGTAYDTLDSTVNGLAETFNIKLGAGGSAQKDMTSFKGHINTVMYGEGGTKKKPNGGVVGATNAAEDATKDYEKTAKDKFGKVSTQVDNWYKTYGKKVQAGEQDTIDLNTALNDLKSVSLTVDTEVTGENEVKALTEAINKVKIAIQQLQNANFKITADVNVNTNNSGSTESDPGRFTYKVARKNTASAAAKEGYVRIEDSSGNYVGYAKDDGSTLQFNSSGDMANITNSGNFYKYMIYDANDASGVLGGVKSLSQGTSTSQWTIDPDNFLSFNGKYSKLTQDDESALKTALKERAGYIQIGSTKYYGFKHGGNWHFAPLSSFTEANAWGENPRLKKGAIYYKANCAWFDTGGYTGEWGSDGRLAMLHQKEIVLNAHDTENFLKAIEIVRGISNRLDQQASIMSMGLSNIFANVMAPKEKSDTLQQEIHITAEFPNATNHSEIEEAFRNLPNLAAQYANQK